MGLIANMDRILSGQGLITTHANNRFINGTAASATALSTGVKTNINYIGVDKNLKAPATIAKKAKNLDLKNPRKWWSPMTILQEKKY